MSEVRDGLPKIPVRLIACDIDDTLVPFGEKAVSEENMRAIADARAKGVLVTLATGRHYVTALARIEEMNAQDLPVIASSGADVRIDGKSVYVNAMDDALVEQIVRDLADRGVPQYLFCGDEILCLPQDVDKEMFDIWTREASGRDAVRVVEDMDDLLRRSQGSTQKMLTFAGTESEHEELLRHLQEAYGDGVDIMCGGGLNAEMNARDVSKARGLEVVCSILDVPMEAVMAIGDSGNDAAMLEAAGLGVAVGNAMEVARDAADVVVASSAENGVAQAIRRFVLREDE